MVETKCVVCGCGIEVGQGRYRLESGDHCIKCGEESNEFRDALKSKE